MDSKFVLSFYSAYHSFFFHLSASHISEISGLASIKLAIFLITYLQHDETSANTWDNGTCVCIFGRDNPQNKIIDSHHVSDKDISLFLHLGIYINVSNTHCITRDTGAQWFTEEPISFS